MIRFNLHETLLDHCIFFFFSSICIGTIAKRSKRAYEAGDLKQCQTLLTRGLEEGKELKEKAIAVNTSIVRQSAVHLAEGDLDQADKFSD